MTAGLPIFSDDWRKFFEVSYDGIIIANGRGEIVYMNPASERLEEVGKDYILGKTARALEEEGVYETSVTVQVLERKKAVSVMQYKGGKQLVITGIPIFENEEIKWVYINERDVTELNKVKETNRRANRQMQRYKQELEALRSGGQEEAMLATRSTAMEKVMGLLARIAPTDVSVLIEGESGVGKDLYARWVHGHSPRKNKPFVKIDCGTLSENLLESELFGYVRGAFTGANREGKQGLVEAADGGTLFLDEIGEMPLGLQAKLLRLLQEQAFLPVGGVTEKRVDLRVIAATNRDLQEMVDARAFRGDLYYRLNVIPVRIPALRERREDLFYFIEYFLHKYNAKHGFHKEIANSAINLLCRYDWPGNVRELANVMERLIVVTPRPVIEADGVRDVLPDALPLPLLEMALAAGADYETALRAFEKHFLQAALAAGAGETLAETAARLCISESTLKRKLKKYGLRQKDREQSDRK